MTHIKEQYHSNMTLAEAEKLVLGTLKSVMEEKIAKEIDAMVERKAASFASKMTQLTEEIQKKMDESIKDFEEGLNSRVEAAVKKTLLSKFGGLA